eukprot:TRINITY_DN8057_c0_g1_i1.p1 TRINITY_DN8057_c0_g1~~TRINITY_DN8057_c0_g1_i1.p1  ORF type:complete len:807 (+),score=133.92 TRINITY_DN8057_c0_g1_i1:160-2421(+)
MDKMVWKQIITPGSPGARYGCTIVAATDQLFLFGGAGLFGLDYNDVWIIYSNRVPPVWEELKLEGLIPTPRYGHTAWLFNTQMVIYGGSTTGGNLQSDMWEFDTQSLGWRHCFNGLSLLWGHALVNQNREYLIGGVLDGDVPHTIHKIYRYDNRTFQLILTPLSPSGVFNSKSATAIFGGKMIAHGGTQYNTPQVRLVVYDLENLDYSGTEAFSTPQPSATYGHSFISYGSQAFLFGGYGTTYLNTLWKFSVNPLRMCSNSTNTTNCWTCALGSFKTEGGCTNCPAGTFGLNPWSCSPCDKGFYGTYEGVSSSDFCKPCPESTYSDKQATTVCSPCPIGQSCPFGCVQPLNVQTLSNISQPLSSTQPELSITNPAEEKLFTMVLWSFAGSIILLLLLLSILVRKKFDEDGSLFSKGDVLFDLSHRQVLSPGMFVVRTSPCGGLLTFAVAVMSIALAINYVVPYIKFNSTEVQILLPNYLVWRDGKPVTTAELELEFQNYGGKCVNEVGCVSGINITWSGMSGEPAHSCWKGNDQSCHLKMTCKSCTFSTDTSGEGQAIISVSISEPNVYASIINWKATATTSLPPAKDDKGDMKERLSIIKCSFTAPEQSVFRGSVPSKVFIRSIQSHYTNKLENMTSSGYHLEYLSSEPGDSVKAVDFYHKSNLNIFFYFSAAETTLDFSGIQQKDILVVVSQVLGAINGLIAGFGALLRILELIGIVDDTWEKSFKATIQNAKRGEDKSLSDTKLIKNAFF